MQNCLNFRYLFFLPIFLIGVLTSQTYSQLPSLTLAPGARQLGMGEAFTGLADDAYAVFFNPAGLAFFPLSDEWSLERKYLPQALPLLVSQNKSNLFSLEKVWSSQQDTLFFFNGKLWLSDYIYLFEKREDVKQIVKDYVGLVSNLDSLVQKVMKYNNWKRDDPNKELRLPLNLIFEGQHIKAIAIDKNKRIWVGTNEGLYRFNGSKWKDLSKAKIFEKNQNQKIVVTSLKIEKSNVWIGTENGLYRYRQGYFSRRGHTILPQQNISVITTQKTDDFIYVAYLGGIARYKPPKKRGEKGRWKLFTKDDGLYSDTIVDMQLDFKGNLWVVHPKAVSHFTLLGWKRTVFKNYHLTGVSVDENNHIWVSTDQGVWRNRYDYKNKKNEWTHYHTGNALTKNKSLALSSSGDNTWFITQAGIEKYSSARTHLGFFFENILPSLRIDNLFHAFLVATFPLKEWGTVGGFVNFLSLGSTQSDTEEGELLDPGIELAVALSYGTKITPFSSIGVNFKFIYVSLGIGSLVSGGDGIAISYAFDLSFLFKDFIFSDLHFGINIQNIGPGISFVEQSQEDPLPFTWKLGLAYGLLKTSYHKITLVADLNRTTVYENRSPAEVTPFYIGSWKDLVEPFGKNKERNDDLVSILHQNFRKSIYNLGMEYTYAQVVALRMGYLLDLVGQRKELDLGVGFFVSDVFKINGAFLRDLGSGIRTGQFRVDLLFSF